MGVFYYQDYQNNFKLLYSFHLTYTLIVSNDTNCIIILNRNIYKKQKKNINTKQNFKYLTPLVLFFTYLTISIKPKMRMILMIIKINCVIFIFILFCYLNLDLRIKNLIYLIYKILV